MNMKKKFGLYPLMLATIAGGFSFSAFAYDGKVDITGEVVSNTCSVSSAGSNATVALDKISTSSLAAAGSSGGFKSFTINVTGCDSKYANGIKAGFEVGSTTDVESGRLNLIAASGGNSAGNVQLQLRNADNTVIKIGDNSTVKGANVKDGKATLSYLVGYYATGTATAGAANSNVTYTLAYP
ncbi:fimbrial protein [Pseudomonas sp. KCJK9016]|uniref:fimbrial protein n=1 Tax=Pseudomonas sp. KCJK9016 TaxID=3344556 RepID=UPI003906567A